MVATANDRSTAKILAILFVAGALLLGGFLAGFLAHRPLTTWLYKREAEKQATKYLDRPARVSAAIP